MRPLRPGAKAVLSCLELDGKPRYDLPALYAGQLEGLEAFWRPGRPKVVHYARSKTIWLADPEVVLLMTSRGLCISLSIDANGLSRDAYVNIGLPPERTDDGYAWKDLELDVRVIRDYSARWRTIVLDFHEFAAAELAPALHDRALDELAEARRLVAQGVFPFTVEQCVVGQLISGQVRDQLSSFLKMNESAVGPEGASWT